MTNEAKPGAILKDLRTRNGWTLSHVSERTGFTISTLSKIENDKVSLSYDKLARISKGLDVDIGLFFAGEAAHRSVIPAGGGRRSIIRKGDGQTMQAGSYFNRFLATDLLNKRFIPLIGESFTSSIEEFGEMIRHEGEEFCYVLEGTMELHTDLYAPVRLESGDAIYFDSGMGHAYISVGKLPCRALCICSGEESKLSSLPGAEEVTPTEGWVRPQPRVVHLPAPAASKSRKVPAKTPHRAAGGGKQRALRGPTTKPA